MAQTTLAEWMVFKCRDYCIPFLKDMYCLFLWQVGGRRGPDLQERHSLRPYFGAGPSGSTAGSGYFPVGDYRNILKYAQKHFIEVIPEIDFPGHSHAAIRSMEARYRKYITLNQTDKALEYLLSDPDDKSVYVAVNLFRATTINVCMESALRFAAKVISAVVDMHKVGTGSVEGI